LHESNRKDEFLDTVGRASQHTTHAINRRVSSSVVHFEPRLMSYDLFFFYYYY
jgi:predicted component of type VI protein secretion system